MLRCERRIGNGDNPRDHHTEQAVINKWCRKINEWLQVDCLLANSFLYERKALNTKKVYYTWAKHKHGRHPSRVV